MFFTGRPRRGARKGWLGLPKARTGQRKNLSDGVFCTVIENLISLPKP